MRVDRSRITDGKGRRVIVDRVSPRGPVEAASRARQPAPAPEPELRSRADLKRKLDELSSRVRRLAPPMNSDPERFHMERSEIARELQRLAEQV